MTSYDEFSIASPEDLESWLSDKPRDWAQAIALRLALRIAPLVFVSLSPTSRVSRELGKLVTLGVFRALFVSWAYLQYGSSNRGNSTQIESMATSVREASSAVASAANKGDKTSHSGYSMERAIANVARVAVSAAQPRAPSAVMAGEAYQAAFAAVSMAETFELPDISLVSCGPQILASINSDAMWLANNPEGSLIEQPMWLLDVRGDTKYKVNFPTWIREHFDAFANDGLAKNTPWELWVAWYRSLLPNRSHGKLKSYFGTQADLQLASQPKMFWDRDPDVVMEDIAELKRTGGLGEQFEIAHSTAGSPIEGGGQAFPDSESDPQMPSVVNTQLQFLSDDVDSSVDYLNRTRAAFILAMRLNQIWDRMTAAPNNCDKKLFERSPGFVVHIDSPWGGGKTTFIDHVAHILNPWAHPGSLPGWMQALPFDGHETWPKRYRRPWIIVKFNAWRHQHVTPPWWVFYESIRRGGARSSRRGTNQQKAHNFPPPTLSGAFPVWWKRRGSALWRWICEMVWRIWTPAFRIRLFFSAVVLGTVAAVLWEVGSLGEGAAALLAVAVAAMSPLLALLASVHSTLLTGTPDAARNYALGAGDPFERFRRHFARMVKGLKRPMLVIVDDLDRCEADYVVELIRGMQTLFLSRRVIFVILGDRDWIQRSFENSFKQMSGIDVGREHNFGARFVEKAIQFSYILPEVTEDTRRVFIRNLLGLSMSDNVTNEGVPLYTESDLREARDRVLKVSDYREREDSAQELLVSDRIEGLDEQSREAFERSLNIALSLRAAADESAEEATKHMIEPLTPVLPSNPRQIKRIVNAISFMQEIARLENFAIPGTPKWQLLARWIILMAELPKTWFTLSRYPEVADVALAAVRDEQEEVKAASGEADETDGVARLIKYYADKIKTDVTAMSLLFFKSDDPNWNDNDLNSAMILKLCELIPPTSGDKI